MSSENIYDLYITDKDRNILLEERSIDVNTAEKVIRDYPWRNGLQSYAQLWKYYMKATNNFLVGFSDKASHFKLPLPYVGATYGLLNNMDKVSKTLNLFFAGEFEKLGKFLAKYRPEQKGD